MSIGASLLITDLPLVITCVGLVLYMRYVVVMASVATYVQCTGTCCMTCFTTFDELIGHSYPFAFLMFLMFYTVITHTYTLCRRLITSSN